MIALAAAVFAASLMGSLHCAGMCGAFVAFAVGIDGTATRPSRTALQSAYHAGRLVTYTALGAAAGSLGGAFDLAGQAMGVQRLAVAFAGAIMIVFGVVTLLRLRGVRLPAPPVPAGMRSLATRALHAAVEQPPLARAALTGLSTTLLPCGWLYAFVVTASGTGSAPRGAAVMAVFWLGTLPVLVAIGAGVQRLAARLGPLGRHVPAVMASLVIGVGLLSVFDRGRLDARLLAAVGPARADAPSVRGLASLEPPCCHERAERP